MMTFIMPRASAASVPGRRRSQYLDLEAIHVSCGSMVTSSLPRFMASTIQWPRKASELHTTGFVPQMTMHSGICHSGSFS